MTNPKGQWVEIGTGPLTIFWGLGYLKFATGDVAPAGEHDCVIMHAQGQVRSLAYNGLETVWVRTEVQDLTIQVVQMSTSELYLVDAAGNILIDGVS